MYISKAKVNKNFGDDYVRNSIANQDSGVRRSSQHNLVWTLFGDHQDRTRDFLYCEHKGEFIIYSERKPVINDRFIDVQTKGFDVNLSEGDKISFKMTVNATNRERMSNGKTRHNDIVMNALRHVNKSERDNERFKIADEVASKWFDKQGDRSGFRVNTCIVDDYKIETMRRYNNNRNLPQLGILELSGVITITNPEKFKEKLKNGFGRAKAFGCGMMLIKRT